MTRAQLIAMAQHNIAHVKAGTIDQEPDVLRVPAMHYYDRAHWHREVDLIFKRVPLMLALSVELENPGDYKSIEAAGILVLIVRGDDGQARAFVNLRSHRGSVIVQEGGGNARRFTCPYHAWTYDQRGALVAIYAERDFGEIDHACHGLTALPLAERAGLIWVTLNPQSMLDTNTFLSGYDDLLHTSVLRIGTCLHAVRFRDRTGKSPTTATSTCITCRSCTRTRSARRCRIGRCTRRGVRTSVSVRRSRPC
jgi:nitrite reductase/ring-hydroxylating ferredoxin subunit